MYMGNFVREYVFDNAVKNDSFCKDVVLLLEPLATLMLKDDMLTSRASRSAEAEVFHQHNIENKKLWLAKRIIAVSREYCKGRLTKFVHLDNFDEIDAMLADFWEACSYHIDDLYGAC